HRVDRGPDKREQGQKLEEKQQGHLQPPEALPPAGERLHIAPEHQAGNDVKAVALAEPVNRHEGRQRPEPDEPPRRGQKRQQGDDPLFAACGLAASPAEPQPRYTTRSPPAATSSSSRQSATRRSATTIENTAPTCRQAVCQAC